MDTETLLERYEQAKSIVRGSGFESEIKWTEETVFDNIDRALFLQEAAWVVLNSGMRESVIRKKYSRILIAFRRLEDLDLILKEREIVLQDALRVFGHRKKMEAILEIVRRVHEMGYEEVCRRVLADGIKFIQTFPFMGPATSYHFARNIGLDAVKPDRHLIRIATVTGYETPHALCQQISEMTGDRIGVVDVVLWRFATIYPKYREFFE